MTPRGLSEEELPDDETVEEEFAPLEQGDNAADPASLKKKRKRNARQMTEREQFWHSVLSSEVGRSVVWQVLESCGTFTNPSGVTPAGYPDQATLMFNLGKKSIGDALYHMLCALNRAAMLQVHDEHDIRFIGIAKAKGHQ